MAPAMDLADATGWVIALAATAFAVVLRIRLRAARARVTDERQRADEVDVRDALTGCLNRAGLDLLGSHVVTSARRRGDSVHAVLVEVDGLDTVSRRLGDPARDAVLVAVAASLRRVTREADVVGRPSPSTFAVVAATGSTPPAELERRLRVDLLEAPPVPPSEWPCLLTAGGGVLEPWDTGQLDDVLRMAERDAELRQALRSPSAPEPRQYRP